MNNNMNPQGEEEDKKRLCRFCKWLVHTKGRKGFCEATYKSKNINSTGVGCEEYAYNPNDTFYYIGETRK